MQLAEWVDTDDLTKWVEHTVDTMLALVSDLADDDPRWIGPQLEIVNPPIWEIAHAAWFAEWLVCRQLHGRAPLMPGADALYDSGAVDHSSRWNLDYPSVPTTKHYLRQVAEALAECLADPRGLDSTDHFVAYAVTHFDAHCEALSYTRQTLGWGPVPPRAAAPHPAASHPAASHPAASHAAASHPATRASDAPAPESAPSPIVGPRSTPDSGGSAGPAGPEIGDALVPGGTFLLGASRSQPLVMDNEKWAHLVEVEEFAMGTTPVTVGQYATFVEEGCYDDEASWTPEGWTWRQTHRADHPVYWRRAHDGFELGELGTWMPVEARRDHPMIHVSWHEAHAWCTWAGRRLPTEAEWEVAATTGPAQSRRPRFPWGDRAPRPDEANLGEPSGGTVPVWCCAPGDGGWGHRQLLGNVWEWTQSTFEPYPLFEPDAYRDNSEPWFGTRKVLRGGSFATQPRYLRSTFRNYFTPDRRDVYAGFRTCAL